MTQQHWDHQSGIRERLALLAQFGPTELNPHVWGYNPNRDIWYYCGEYRGSPAVAGRGVQVRQEGVASLALILERWQMGRADAMAFIGYPEGGRS